MKDRIPANPGRVLITPENGAAYYATLSRADNPVQEGDALNKQNLLPDEVAEKLGLNPADNPVPADAFEALAENMELLWENASPASSFAAQSINVITEEELYLVELYGFTDLGKHVSIICRKGIMTRAFYLDDAYTPNVYVGVASRDITISDGVVVVADGHLKLVNSTSQTVSNGYLRLGRIYGIKGVS